MDKIFGLIGLAKRAGKTAGGEFSVTASIKDKSAKLVIIAIDASDNTKKNISNSCRYYNIDYIEYGGLEELGKFTGSEIRAVVSVKDSGFADAIKKHFEHTQGF